MRKHHKEDSSGWEIKRTVRGSRPKWKDTFFIDDKGGRDLSDAEDRGMVPEGVLVIDMMHGSKGSMSGMILVLHQSVSINAKWGDC